MTAPATTFRFPDTAGRWREARIADYSGSHHRETVDVVRGLLVLSGLPFVEYGRAPGDESSRELLRSPGRPAPAVTL